MANPLYGQYQQGQRSPMAQLQTNRMGQQAEQEGDTNFRDIWNYLKWLKRGYDVYAKATGSPSLGQYGRQAWDWATGAGEGGATAATAETPALGGAVEAYPAAEGATAGVGAGAGDAASMGAGGWASLAAPLVMTWLAYTRGSGRNEPVEKRMESLGTIPLIKQLSQGVDVDPNDYWDKFRQQPKHSVSTSIGADQPGWTMPASEKYTINDLWHNAHARGTGAKQLTGNSGLSDTQIDDMILNSGVTQEDLLKALKLDQMPDWSKYSYDTWYANTFGDKATSNFQNWL